MGWLINASGPTRRSQSKMRTSCPERSACLTRQARGRERAPIASQRDRDGAAAARDLFSMSAGLWAAASTSALPGAPCAHMDESRREDD